MTVPLLKVVLELSDVANAQEESTESGDERGQQRYAALASPIEMELTENRMLGHFIDLRHDFRQASLDERARFRGPEKTT